MCAAPNLLKDPACRAVRGLQRSNGASENRIGFMIVRLQVPVSTFYVDALTKQLSFALLQPQCREVCTAKCSGC